MAKQNYKKWEYTGKGNLRRSRKPKVVAGTLSLPPDLYEKALPYIREQGFTAFATEAIREYIKLLEYKND